MSKIIIGRTEEIVTLNAVFNSDKSEFIAITGRRRVGKTYLINAHFEKEMTFHFRGILNASMTATIAKFQLTIGTIFQRNNY